MTLNIRVDNLRRSIRNDRMKQVYDAATAAGWSARLRGSGHIRMTAPNDKRTFLTISCTASGARSALNVEAVLKRWQREQEVQTVSNERIDAAITRVETDQTLDALGLKHGVIPDIPEREPEQPATYDGRDGSLEISAADEQALIDGKPPKSDSDEVVCPDCGRTFKRYGFGPHAATHKRAKSRFEDDKAGADRRHNQREAAKEAAKVAPVNGSAEPVFTIEQIVTVANYGGSGGLIEVTKLEEGLRLIAQMRGS